MQVFKTALKTVFRHPAYLLIYAVALGFMGVAMASSFSFEGSTDPFSEHKGTYALIDRDHSALSASLDDVLSKEANRVDVADEELALQDLVAKGKVSLLVIVPEGFEEDVLNAAKSGTDLPALQTVSGYYSAEGSLLEETLDDYVGIMGAYATTETDTTSIARKSYDAMAKNSSVESVSFSQGNSEAQRFAFFLQWSTYTLFASIIASVGLMMSKLERTDVRRRNLVAPMSNLALSTQTAAAGFVVMLAVWAWTVLLGIVAFPDSVAAIGTAGMVFALLAALVYATVPLAVGFLLGKLDANEIASNAVGNILGMVFSFLGGAWISMDLLGPEVQVLAHFSPAFWYNEAVSQAVAISSGNGFDSGMLAAYGMNLGVVALFAICVFFVALLVGKLRMQSATAGGNAAAEAVQA